MVNIYAVITGALKYIKQILTYLKGEIDNTIIGNFNTLLSAMDRSSRHRIRKCWN